MKSDNDLTGQVLHDTHRIVRVLGRGGMGVVYEAVHARLANRRFAIKVLHRDAAADPEVLSRFMREAKLANDLKHPNIVEVYDFYETPEGRPCMVMEFLQGQDLSDLLAHETRLSLERTVRIMRQVGDALATAHQRGVVHRDLKPGNIFLLPTDEGEHVKLLDFGISKIAGSKTIVTRERDVMGTPQYMSPEQAEGQIKHIDHLTDIFAMGTICYQCLSGVIPFDATSIPAMFYRICHHHPPPVTRLVPGLPLRLDEVLGRAMAKEKSERYPHVDDFLSDLAACLDPNLPRAEDALAAPAPTALNPSDPGTLKGIQAPTSRQHNPPSFLETPGPRPDRRRLLAGLAGTAALLAAGAMVLIVQHRPPPPTGQTDDTPAALLERDPAAASGPRLAQGSALGSTTPAPAPASAPSTPEAKAEVRLELTPPSARVFLDGEARSDNPMLLERSDRVRHLRLTAEDHEPLEATVVVEGDQVLRYALLPKKRRARRSGSADPSGAATPSTTAGHPTPGGQPATVPATNEAAAQPKPAVEPAARPVPSEEPPGQPPRPKAPPTTVHGPFIDHL